MSFTVCKIEAGRAILLSQDDFEIIEFPAKLLPTEIGGSVKIEINRDESCEISVEKTKKLLKEVEKEFGIEEGEVERIKKEIGSDDFLMIDKLGSTAAILRWKRKFPEIFGKSVQIENVLLTIEDSYSNYHQEYVDFILRGQKQIKFDQDLKCRINLPIDLNVSLLVNSSIGYFYTNQVELKCKKYDDFSGIYIITDVQDTTDDDQIFVKFKNQGGNIIKSATSATSDISGISALSEISEHFENLPITAIITDSFNSNLFKFGIDNNLPVVSITWLENLLFTGELPHFEDYLLKR